MDQTEMIAFHGSMENEAIFEVILDFKYVDENVDIRLLAELKLFMKSVLNAKI